VTTTTGPASSPRPHPGPQDLVSTTQTDPEQDLRRAGAMPALPGPLEQRSPGRRSCSSSSHGERQHPVSTASSGGPSPGLEHPGRPSRASRRLEQVGSGVDRVRRSARSSNVLKRHCGGQCPRRRPFGPRTRRSRTDAGTGSRRPVHEGATVKLPQVAPLPANPPARRPRGPVPALKPLLA